MAGIRKFITVLNLIIFVFAMLLLIGFQRLEAETIEAERIVLKNGSASIELSVESGTPQIVMTNQSGAVIARVTQGAQGHAHLVLNDASAKPCLEMSAGAAPSVRLYEQEKVVAEMTVIAGRGSLIKLNDGRSLPRLQLQGGNAPAILLKSESQQIIGSLFTLQDGGGAMGLTNAEGEVAALMRGGQTPNISFFQGSQDPNIAMGIAKGVPHMLLTPTSGEGGILMHGGAPTSLLFIDQKGKVPLALSKNGIYQQKAQKAPAKKPKARKYFFSWQFPEDMESKDLSR